MGNPQTEYLLAMNRLFLIRVNEQNCINTAPNKSMQRTTPAPHNVMPLAIESKCSGARVTPFGYHV